MSSSHSQPGRRPSESSPQEGSRSGAARALADEAAQAVREHELDRRELLIGKRISAGSFALVYAGRYRGELVAIKVLRSERVQPKDFQTYIKEVQLIQSFNHPQVLRFVGVCCEPPHVCIVTEFLECGSLFHLLHPRPPAGDAAWRPERLGMLRVLRYAEGIALGMQYLHSCAVIHRDLKSGNILLDGRDNIKVADFGVARRLSSCSESMTAETGTYRWMAPEVIRHSRYDNRVDLYSFAIVLWEMLSGKLPYGELSPIAAAAAVVVENLRPPVADTPADTPAELLALMVTCWDVAPAARPEFEAVVASLAALRAVEATAAAARSAAGEDSGSSRLFRAMAAASPAAAAAEESEEVEGPSDASQATAHADAVARASQLRPLSQLETGEQMDDGELVLSGSVAAEAGHAAYTQPAARSAPQRRKTGGLLEMMGCCTAPNIAGNSL